MRYHIPHGIPVEFLGDFARWGVRSLADLGRGVWHILRYHGRRPCRNCGMQYCDGHICRELAERRRQSWQRAAEWEQAVVKAPLHPNCRSAVVWQPADDESLLETWRKHFPERF